MPTNVKTNENYLVDNKMGVQHFENYLSDFEKELYDTLLTRKQSRKFLTEKEFYYKLDHIESSNNQTVVSIIQDNKYKFTTHIPFHIPLLQVVYDEQTQFNEYVNLDKPFKFHIDFDSKDTNILYYKDIIIDALQQVLLRNDLRYIITGSDDYNKNFHLILPDIIMPNGNTYVVLMRRLDKLLIETIGNDIIEDKRYNSYKQNKPNKLVSLRAIGSYKNGVRQKVIKECNFDVPLYNHCVLTFIDEDDNRNFMHGKLQLEENKKQVSDYDRKITSPLKSDEVIDILDNLSNQRFENFISWRAIIWIMVAAQIDAETIHEYSQRGSNYDFDATQRLINDFDENSFKSTVATLYKYLQEDVPKKLYDEIRKRYKPKEKEIDSLEIEAIDVEGINEYEIMNDNNVGSYIPRLENNKGLFVRSNCMTYKTQNLKEIFSRYDKILMIPFRRSLGKAYSEEMKEFGFDYYLDINSKTYNSKRLICQLDSIHKVRGQYDLLVLDEFEYTKLHLTGTTVRDKKETFECLSQHVSSCQKYIVLDALLSNDTVKLFNRIDDGNKYVLINDYKSFSNRDVFIDFNINAVEQYILSKLKDGLKIVVPTNSKVRAIGINEAIKFALPNIKTLLITSDTEEDVDVNNWVEYDCVIYTPTVVAGNSFNHIHFDECVAYFSFMSAPAEIALQMLFRVRNLKNEKMTVYVKTADGNNPVTDLQLDNYFDNKEDIITHETGLTLNYCRNTVVKNPYYILYRSVAKRINLSKNRYIDVLMGLLSLHGAQIKVDMRQEEYECIVSDDDIKAAVKQYKEKETKKILEAELITSQQYEILKNKDKCTKDERCEKQKFVFWHTYNLSNDAEISVDTYQKYVNHMVAFKNLRAYNKGYLDDRLCNNFHDEHSILNHNMEFVKFSMAKQILEILGYERFTDTKEVEIDYELIHMYVLENKKKIEVAIKKGAPLILNEDPKILKMTLNCFIQGLFSGLLGPGARLERRRVMDRNFYSFVGVNEFFTKAGFNPIENDRVIEYDEDIYNDITEFVIAED